MGAKCSFCRVRGQESKLSYRPAEQEWLKNKQTKKNQTKKTLGIFRSAYSSLHLLCSQEGEREKLISLLFFLFTATNSSFFCFHCNPITLESSSPTHGYKPRENRIKLNDGNPCILGPTRYSSQVLEAS